MTTTEQRLAGLEAEVGEMSAMLAAARGELAKAAGDLLTTSAMLELAVDYGRESVHNPVRQRSLRGRRHLRSLPSGTS